MRDAFPNTAKRAAQEGANFFNRTGEGLTALVRLILILAQLALLGVARLLNLVEESLDRTEEITTPCPTQS